MSVGFGMEECEEGSRKISEQYLLRLRDARRAGEAKKIVLIKNKRVYTATRYINTESLLWASWRDRGGVKWTLMYGCR